MNPTVVLVAGLAFGDEGKGTTVDYLTRQLKAKTVVRYNGGAQAAHNVVLDDGRHHTFQQFGAGTFAGARTFLSRHVLVNPVNLLAEARVLSEKGVRDPLRLAFVDHRARVITPFHVAANRLRELHRGSARHGSCGEGVGETVSDWIEHGHEMIDADDLLRGASYLRTKLLRVRALKRDQMRVITRDLMSRQAVLSDAVDQELRMLMDDHVVDMALERFKLAAPLVVDGDEQFGDFVREGDPIVFEGAQGVLLDECRGFHPYTTWSNTTFENADAMLAPFGVRGRRVGVLRAYATRHGAGPFVTEDAGLGLPDAHNGDGQWQGAFRVGHPDAVMMRYAAEACGGVDEVALTHLDRVPERLRICTAYEGVEEFSPTSDLGLQQDLAQRLLQARPVYSTIDSAELAHFVERSVGAPVAVWSYGPRASDKKGT